MSRVKNEPIGEVECPHRGCTYKAKVFKFQTRAGADASRTRFAGKLYADCVLHGRYGADGKQAAQDYILENATIWAPSTQPAPTPSPAASVTPTAAAPVAAPAAPEKRRSWWTEESGTLIK